MDRFLGRHSDGLLKKREDYFKVQVSKVKQKRQGLDMAKSLLTWDLQRAFKQTIKIMINNLNFLLMRFTFLTPWTIKFI